MIVEFLVSRYRPRRVINGRSVKRNTRWCGGVEVWRWMHLHDPDFYYRILGAGICAVLTTDFRIDPCKACFIKSGKSVLPADNKFLGLLPNRQVLPNRAAIQLLGLTKQDTGTHRDSAYRIFRHRRTQFQFTLQAILQSFQQ